MNNLLHALHKTCIRILFAFYFLPRIARHGLHVWRIATRLFGGFLHGDPQVSIHRFFWGEILQLSF